MKKTKRVVLISGDSSGFGLEMVKLFIKNGDIVCGMSKNEFALDNLYHQVGDISLKEDCQRVVNNILNRYKRIDILINNAGFGVFGPIEETSLNSAKSIMEVNFLGAFNLTSACLETFRKQKEGKIINTSSIASCISLPFQGFYSSCKAAMDTLFNALRAEVYPYNIQICSIKPGDAKTSFTKNRKKDLLKEDSVYKKAYERCLKQIEKDEQGGISPIKIAKKAFKVSLKKRMPYSKCVGFKDTLLLQVYRFLPKRIATYLLYLIYAK